STDDVLHTLDDAASTAGDLVDEAGKVVDEVGGALDDAGRAVAEGAEIAYDTAVETGGQIVDAAGQAVDWLATEAGKAAQALADATGGIISVTSAGLVISVPKICPLDAYTDDFDLGSMDEEFMVPIGGLPLGPVALLGEVGIAGHLAARAAVQLGPFCINGLRIVVNPLTNTYSFSYSVSATAAASLAAEIRGGLRGALSLFGVIPIGGVPVPIEVPLIGVEGGLAGLVRGIAATTLTIGSSRSIGGTTLSMTEDRTLDLGLAADLFLGAYAQLDILGKNVCRIYWQPYDWHGDIAGSLDLGVGVTISAGASPSVALTVTPPSFTRIPFSDIPLALSREGFADDCPIKDAICEVLTALHLLPSQNGGVWNWGGPYGPGPRLAGPLDVYQKNPGIASGSECRGACGPNCDTCTPTPKYLYTDPATGDVWEYADFQDCNYQQGCLDHDAAFDWAADKHGETGGWAIIMPWHMAANIECGCNNLGGNCIAWVAGLPPYSGKIYFAAGATLVTPGGLPPVGPTPGTLGTGCHTDFPNAPECTASFPERDAVLEAWGTPNRIVDFRDCAVALSGAAMSLAACNGGPGNLWRCKATDEKTGEDVTVSIQECICCNPDDSRSSEWMQPQIVVTPDMSEELILELCERRLIARVICIPIEEDMLARFGRRRDMNVDPDKDPKTEMRPDDAPILESFRRAHNRLDSWDLYIGARHPDLVAEFEAVEGGCATRSVRDERMANVKKRTARYKTEFRDTRNTDPQKTAADYEADIRAIQTAIETCISAVAKWYLARTGSSESEADVTERVHVEGTEIWREKWRKASLQVNRILARLWPGARTRILVWVGVKRAEHPGTDLSGGVGELDYIGSLATGFKGPPKQQIRFDPRKFDVDANLDAPPLAKYAIAFAGARPDRGRIFGRTSLCDPLIEFSNSAGTELASVEGYDTSDLFDVALVAVPLPEQARGTAATERLYALRQTLIDRSDEASYTKMVDELNAAGLLAPDGRFREEISEDEAAKANEIMDRYEKAPAPTP
ncbi:MAG: hypothetical protein JWM26_1379, partial [Betaproteobacteria bacterium]|nr:hypothetical protein [Betaproteobacteria bacterium]